MIPAGKYNGVVQAAWIHTGEQGSVSIAMNIEVEGEVLKGFICLVTNAGDVREKGIVCAQKIFNLPGAWDWDLWDAEPESFAGPNVTVDVIEDEYKGRPVSKIDNVWPVDSIQKADISDLKAKYGAKFRAICGSSEPKAKPPVKTPPAEKPAVKKPGVPPSTFDKAWEGFTVLHDGKTDEEMYALWFPAIEKFGKSQDQMTADDWGQLLAQIKDDIDKLPIN